MFDFDPLLQPVLDFVQQAMSLLNPATFFGGVLVLYWMTPLMVRMCVEMLDLAGGSGFGGYRRFISRGGFGRGRRGSRRGGWGGSRSSGRNYNSGSSGSSRPRSSGISSWSQSKAKSSRGSYRPGSYGGSSRGFRSPGKLSDWNG